MKKYMVKLSTSIFIDIIRDEIKFEQVDQLIDQMKDDEKE